MSSVEGAAGAPAPAAPSGQPVRPDPFFRRVGTWFRHNEEHGWRWSTRIAVYLPLAALIFAVAVLVNKAWPAIRVNGWDFFYGKNWTYGQSYGTVVHTDGVAHAAGSQ